VEESQFAGLGINTPLGNLMPSADAKGNSMSPQCGFEERQNRNPRLSNKPAQGSLNRTPKR